MTTYKADVSVKPNHPVRAQILAVRDMRFETVVEAVAHCRDCLNSYCYTIVSNGKEFNGGKDKHKFKIYDFCDVRGDKSCNHSYLDLTIKKGLDGCYSCDARIVG